MRIDEASLISEASFYGILLLMLVDFLIFGASLGVVLWSGGLLVRALSRAAAFLEISEFVVSFIIVAVATSLPELFVGIASGIRGVPELSFANVMGSNIVNMTLMIAIPAIMARGIVVAPSVTYRDALFMAAIALLPVLLLVDGLLSRVDGIVLLLVFVWYFSQLIRQQAQFGRELHAEGDASVSETLRHFLRDVGIILTGFVLLLAGSNFVVESASTIATDIGVPIALIGVLIVGFGTNLPELAFGTQAVRQGHADMVLGGILGSIVANASLIVGGTMLFAELAVSAVPAFAIEGLVLLLAVIVLGIVMKTDRRISPLEGFVLIALYGLFVAVELIVLG